MTLAHTNRNDLVAAPDAAPVSHHRSDGSTDLVAWAHQYDAAFRFAGGICNTSFVPAAYRGKAEEAAAAMLAGGELGFSPMTSLRAFDHIQGVTAPKAMTMRAVAQSRGHELWMEESTDERCVMKGRRNGSSEVITSEWTIARAERMGLTGKQQWKSQPKAMLVARATSECARLVASDALLGIPYAAEEIRDDPNLNEAHPDEHQALPSPRQAARGATRTSAADLTGEPADVTAAVEMIDRSQSQRIGKAFKDAGVDQGDRLAIVNRLTDRQVGAASELTKAEADDLLASLADLGPDGIAALVPSAEVDTDPADEHAALFGGAE